MDMPPPITTRKPRVAVHKFSSCDGCQLALLDLGENLLTLAGRVEFVHFAEAGPLAPDAEVDIAFVEGSVATPEDIERLRAIRERSRVLVAIGACATSGGVQALRNASPPGQWLFQSYPQPEAVASLPTSTPLAAHVRVDHELWGCPVNGAQMLGVIGSLLSGVAPPANPADTVCAECKRAGHACVLVGRGEPCMGPVTRAGCGALCPGLGRDCYGCFGPAELAATDALAAVFARLGLAPDAIARRFAGINSQAPAFLAATRKAGEP